MVRTITWILALASLAPPPAVAMEREPEVLMRTGKWMANFDDTSCQLTTQFGTGEDMILARFTRYEPGDAFDFTLFGQRLRTPDATAEAKVDFGLNPNPIKTEVMMGETDKLPVAFFWGLRFDGWKRGSPDDVMPLVTPQQEAGILSATVAIKNKRSMRLVFGPLGKPMETMRLCMNDLVASWGYDPEVQSHLTRPATPITPPRTWIKNDDYPASAIRAEHRGFVQFRLDIDAQGKVAGCHVLARTNPDEFADMTCRILTERAQLLPALDAQNKPVRSYYVGRAKWILP